MSALFLTDDGKERAHEVALFAARPENWYRPGLSTFVPGDRDDYVAIFQSYRCVFSYTEAEGILFRHLSISVRAGRVGKLPHHLAAFTIASWFGFTGGTPTPGTDGTVISEPGKDWGFKPVREPFAHVALVQRIGPAGRSGA